MFEQVLVSFYLVDQNSPMPRPKSPMVHKQNCVPISRTIGLVYSAWASRAGAMAQTYAIRGGDNLAAGGG
jgi:hypothetical protein